MAELKFKPKARMLLQLGDQLIRSESIALIELVKNAYDANARSAKISMKKVEDKAEGQIIIEDDGDGMDADIIENVWMQPGSEYKEQLIQSGKIEESQRTPIGGKGIGRFGVHKLGYCIELTSKRSGSKEVFLKIDWRIFEADAFLSTVLVDIEERDVPAYFTGDKTGTRIVITELKYTWSRGVVRDVYRALVSLNSPFDKKDQFKTYFKLDNQDWLKGLITFEDIKDHALYYADVEIQGKEVKTLNYEFIPWDTMTKLVPRTETLKNISMKIEVRDEHTKKKKQIDIDLEQHKIGPVKLKLLIFDRAGKILSLGVSDKKGFKEYLDQNGGIRVFRNGIRVYDYGEPGNDWLNLDIMRVNQPGKTISNNIIIGAVELQLNSSQDLQEKTNREGFIENEAYKCFVSAIRFTLDKILSQRNIDKEKIRKFYSPSATTQPVLSHLLVMQETISEKVTDTELKDDLLSAISKIEKDYETINEIYTRSSSAGLSLSIVMHEIIHMISELASAVEQNPTDSYVKNLVKALQKTAGDYAGVIKQSKKSRGNLSEIVKQSISNIQFRIKAHDVEVIHAYEKVNNSNTLISCTQNLVTSTIINIIDNSIWWQNYAGVKNKKLYIDTVDYPDNYLSLLIADNGPDFTIPPEEAVKPFMSDKPGGMGLGLHLADEVMKGQKGRLSFPDPYDFEMPEEFQNGAKLLLSFRK